MTKERRTRPRIAVMGGVTGQLRIAGAVPVNVGTTEMKLAEAIEAGAIDGLLLTGGGDVDPELYGQPRHPRSYGLVPKRDLAEFTAIAAADRAGIPIMGICRGAQMMNVAFGGTLHQHLVELPHAHSYHQGHDHRVRTATGSRLRRAFQAEERWVVSIHHQAVDEVAPGFVATAWGLDGIVEAIESVEGWRVGVQFHPELDGTAHSQRLFNAFVRACAKRAGMTAFRTPKQRTAAAGGDRYWERRAEQVREIPPKRRVHVAGEPVITRWRCFRCSDLDFDDRADYVDHMLFIHNVDVLSRVEVTTR